MKINSLLQEGITISSDPANAQSSAPKMGRSDKVLETPVEESTTSGSVASVSSPMGDVQRRGQKSIFKGIQSSDKFPNSQAVKEETTDEGFLGFGSDTQQQPKKKLDYAAARRMSQQANPKMTKQYHPDEYVKKYGAFTEEELEENSMADFFAKAAQEKFPTATIRKNGETIQQAPSLPKQQPAPQAPVDLAALEKQYAELEKRYEQLGGDSWQYADRMMDRDYEAQKVGQQLRIIASKIQQAKQQGVGESRKANTKTARKEFGARTKKPTLSNKEQEKKQSESDRLWAMLQQHIADTEKEKTTNEGAESNLADWQVWNVHVYNNFYRGKYADYGPRLYSVVASSPEEARQVVINNPDYVLQDLLSRKLQNGKRVLPRGSALPVEEKRVGKAEPGSITTMAFKKMLTPDGVQSFKFANGKIVGGAHMAGGEEQGVAEDFDDVVKGVKRYVKGKPSKSERETHHANKTIGAAQAFHQTSDPTEKDYIKQQMFKNADRYYKVKNLPKKVKEGEVTRTSTGLKHTGDYPDYPTAQGREFQTDPNRLNKSETGRLDKAFGVKWEPKGNRKEISGDPTGVNEAEFTEDKLASDLYRDLQIFKKGTDKDIGSKAKDKDIIAKEESKGLWANIHAKRERIKHGSGEKMRKPGSKGAPTAQNFKDAANEAANPAQQAAIAIAMKEKGQKPKNESNSEYDDEAGSTESNLLTTARAVKGLLDTIGDRDNLPEWVQEKIAKAEGMLVTSWDYLQSQKEQGVDPQVDEDWQKTNKQDKTDGMSPKAVKAYRRENPGSKLKTAVTKKPSELKAGSKDAKRRKSFCARMSGVEGPMKDEHGKPTPKAKALKRWNC